MKLEIIKPNEKISNEDIEIVENKYNFTFPKYYREFLLKYNGGKPNELLFNHKFKVNEFSSLSSIESFLEDVKKDMESDEEDYMLWFYKFGKEKMIIIGEIGWVDLDLCVCYSNDNNGKVYFIDSVHEDEFYLLTDNFDDFINSFYPEFANEFHEACEYKNYDKAREIYNNGIDIDLKTYEGASILSLAMKNNLNDIITKIFVEKRPSRMVLEAINYGNLDILEITLQNVNDINERYDHGRTALFYTDIIEQIKLLIAYGIDVNIKDNYGKKAIDYIDPNKFEQYIDLYDLLLKAEQKNN